MSQLHAVTAGVNWYPVGKSRLQFNLIHERLLGATTAAARAPRQTTAVIRFQLYL
jgi:phosphate-selective porin